MKASDEWKIAMNECIAFLERHGQEEHFGHTFADMLREYKEKCLGLESDRSSVRD